MVPDRRIENMMFEGLIDVHTHLGSCRVFDLEVSKDLLIKTIKENNIRKVITQPFPGCPDPARVHDEIAELAAQYPGKIFGLASVNPHQSPSDYKREIRRCIEEYNFVGIKLHTIGHAVDPTSKDGMMVAEVAAEMGKVLMVHTGKGMPFSLPSAVAPIARRFPELKIVLAHAGAGYFTCDALAMAQQFPNIYLELSWCQMGDIKQFYRGLGAERLLFGSDVPINLPIELAKWRTIQMPDEDRQAVLFSNAIRVFNLESNDSTD